MPQVYNENGWRVAFHEALAEAKKQFVYKGVQYTLDTRIERVVVVRTLLDVTNDRDESTYTLELE